MTSDWDAKWDAGRSALAVEVSELDELRQQYDDAEDADPPLSADKWDELRDELDEAQESVLRSALALIRDLTNDDRAREVADIVLNA